MSRVPIPLVLVALLSGCRPAPSSLRKATVATPHSPAHRWQPPSCDCSYAWPHPADAQPLWQRLPSPTGSQREAVQANGFACWLRGLPLRPQGAPVLLYTGRPSPDQSAHAAVVEIDVGSADLQQCADAVLRLRAEYLFSRGQHNAVRFSATNGQPLSWVKWAQGERAVLRGQRLVWTPGHEADQSWSNFRQYLDLVFAYAGTLSLQRDSEPVALADARAGDFFLDPGSPGHAVLVVDLAKRETDDHRLALLLQGFMPAQSLHLLRNPNDASLSPWYDLSADETLKTPQWRFSRDQLRRFPSP